jgi:hypothetical protein
MKMTSKMVTALAGVLLLGSVPARAADPVERYSAYALNLNGARTRSGTVDIAVERWTTNQERDTLVGDLKEGGNDLLLKRLRKADRVGFIRSASSIGYPLRFARAIDLPGGGRRILLATDRPIGFLEATSGARRNDYPFLLIDIRVDANGKGEGKLLNFARVNWADENTLEVENWDRDPVRLTQVTKQD